MNAMRPNDSRTESRQVPRARDPVGSVPQGWLAEPSGWLRFEHGLLTREQVLRNLEQVVSLLQTAQAGLETYDTVLTELTTALSTAWNNREAHEQPPESLRRYMRHQLERLEEIVRQVRFHGRGLINGQSGVAGAGDGVTFIRGGPNTRCSPPEGYEVRVTAFPAQTAIRGGVPLSEDWLWVEKEIFLAEGDRHTRFRPRARESVRSFLSDLQAAIRASGLDLEVGVTQQRQLVVRHTQYGSQFRFKGRSLTTPLLSKRPGKLEWSHKGQDIQGTLAGEPAFGIGRMLVGFLDNPLTSELAVSWPGNLPEARKTFRCHVAQNGIRFQEGLTKDSGLVSLSVPNFAPERMACWVDTRSGFGSLAEICVNDWSEVLDALYLLLAAAGEAVEWKDRIKTWVERYRNRALVALRRGLVLPETPSVSAEPPGGRAHRMADLLRQNIHHTDQGASLARQRSG